MRASGYAVVLATGLTLFLGCSGDEATKASKNKVAHKPRAVPAKKDTALETAYRYDPTGKPDPFKSWIKKITSLTPESAASPLERFDLTQLQITGIIWDMEAPRALIKDPTGKGYIVEEGTPVGKNKGRIMRIDDNRIIVKETYVDFQDRATTKEVELKLYGRNGG